MKNLNIPVGISDFEKIRREGFYYIDKTGLVKELLNPKPAEVTLITRPRRFGKTLAMSMLENFFDIKKNSQDLFAGLEISASEELCSQWMNQCPTVSLSFRQVDGLDFSSAYDMLTMVISNLFNRHRYLLESQEISEFQKTAFVQIASQKATAGEIKNSLILLTDMMQTYYGKKALLLIDEYDVPVAKANNNGLICKDNPPQNVIDAVQSVLGQALYYNGDYALTVYSASSGGYTAAASDVFGVNYDYLISVPCEYDAEYDPHYGTVVYFSEAEIRSRLQSAYNITLSDNPANWISLEIGGGGYISHVTIDGQKTVTGESLRSVLGLKSDRYNYAIG